MKNIIFDYLKIEQELFDKDIVQLLLDITRYQGKQITFAALKPTEIKRLLEMSILQSTESSNRIENINVNKNRLVKLLQNKTKPINRNEEEVCAYKEILDLIHHNYDLMNISSNQIKYIHKQLYYFDLNSKEFECKSNDNEITEIDEFDNKIVRFKPVSAALTPIYMDELCNAFNSYLNSKNSSILIIPVFILDFLCIHPFNDGNGRTSRLLTTLLLYKFGLNICKYISIEKLIEDTKEQYYEVLKQSSINWINRTNDYKPFVKYMLNIIVLAYKKAFESLSVIAQPKFAKEIILNVISNSLISISKKEIAQQCINISESTIELRLNELLKENRIQKLGSNKNAKYKIFETKLNHDEK